MTTVAYTEFKKNIPVMVGGLYGMIMHAARETFIEELREKNQLPQGINMTIAVARKLRKILEEKHGNL